MAFIADYIFDLALSELDTATTTLDGVLYTAQSAHGASMALARQLVDETDHNSYLNYLLEDDLREIADNVGEGRSIVVVTAQEGARVEAKEGKLVVQGNNTDLTFISSDALGAGDAGPVTIADYAGNRVTTGNA